MCRMIIGLTAIVLLAAVWAVFPPGAGRTPRFYDENGEVLAGSLSEKCYLEVDGGKLGMILLARDRNAPVLLVCGGGPGIPGYLLEYLYPSRLSDEFVVCYLEYRGTCLSYDSHLDPAAMTTERYISDIAAVTNYLRERFSQEKLYILGHSFGTYVGLKTVQRYPEYYHAYIAMSQNCNQKESEYRAYDYMKAQYESMDDPKMLEEFAKYPIRESETAYGQYFASPLRDRAMHRLGVGTTRDMDSVITGIFLPSLRCRVYTWRERIHIWQGKLLSSQFPVVTDGFRFNAFEEVRSVELPVYFLAGKYDYTCCYFLQKEYYECLEAPRKEFYTFENAAHSPLFEEPNQALQILREIRNQPGPRM